ncbi:MAG TPA: histidinol dehydrogenase [Hyphomicrobiaceae bacterium]|nr:histidinol dehydrogenase [Hyphomicrobiaceae bacterium]
MAREYLKKAAVSKAMRKAEVEETVRRMLADIEVNRDDAVRKYARELDKWTADFRVTKAEVEAKSKSLSKVFKEDFALCHKNVTEFAKRQKDSMRPFESELTPGIMLGQKLIPVSSVGCYIPGGKYPLISAAIMSVGTAKVAGVGRIVACAPPRGPDGIYPQTLYALHYSGADEIYCLGGVQAMASMAHGCVGMPKADMITGPGNAFVAEAKRQLFGVCGIDLLAGPTEVAVIADEGADPALVATDLLGQAEHGPDSPAWLITTSRALGEAVANEIAKQLPSLPTRANAEAAWRDHGEVVVVDSDDEAIAVSDEYAPEHLELQTRRDDYYLERLKNYGSLFVGEESTVAYGDKGVGTNHTLPTEGAGRYTGGLWVGKFIKTVTYQRLTRRASREIAPAMSRICREEGMIAHAITGDVRVKRFQGAN